MEKKKHSPVSVCSFVKDSWLQITKKHCLTSCLKAPLCVVFFIIVLLYTFMLFNLRSPWWFSGRETTHIDTLLSKEVINNLKKYHSWYFDNSTENYFKEIEELRVNQTALEDTQNLWASTHYINIWGTFSWEKVCSVPTFCPHEASFQTSFLLSSEAKSAFCFGKRRLASSPGRCWPVWEQKSVKPASLLRLQACPLPSTLFV